jgi:predicted permease
MKFKWLRRARREDDLDAEIRSHLELAIRERIERGESPDEARASAMREFGNVALIKDVTREMWGRALLDQLGQDLRYSLRVLRKNPGFSLTAILTLALGIGVNTALFTVFNAVALRPLPVKDPDRIMKVYRAESGDSNREVNGTSSMFSYSEYAAHRDNAHAFSGLTAYAPVAVTLGGTEAEGIKGLLVAANYFSVLGGEMALGRPFAPAECQTPGASPVVVLSHRYWQRRFTSDASLLGKTIILNRQHFTVIGVAAHDFHGAELFAPDLWVPLTMQAQLMPGRDFLSNQNLSWLEVVGRLRPEFSIDQAQAELSLSAAQLDLAYPGRKTQIIVTPGNFLSEPEQREQFMGVALILQVAVGLVLLIACGNVANLSLARAAARQKEIAVRLALGAGRLRLIRQLLTESVLIALFGGAVGLLFAYWTVNTVVAAVASSQDQNLFGLNISPDPRVFGYTMLVSILTGVTFGLAPALQSTRVDLVSAIKDEGLAFGRRFARRTRLRDVLIVAQVTVSLALLITAGLLVRGLQRARTLDPGFKPERVLTAAFDLREQGYDQNRAEIFQHRFGERLEGLPGVTSISYASLPPFSGRRTGSIVPEGSGQGFASFNSVSPNFFETLGIPLLEGRIFSDQEVKEQKPVALINEALAQRYWPGEQPIGKRFRMDIPGSDSSSMYQVIGIVKTVRSIRLGAEDGPYFYLPIKPADRTSLYFLLRSSGNPELLINAVREASRQLDPQVRVSAKALAANLRDELFEALAFASFAGAVGLLALSLASVGLYGVMSYAVNQRTREIGIRIALGAQKFDVLSLMMRQGMRLVAIGITLGLAVAAAASKITATLLFGVSTLDPLAFFGISIFLASIALLACWFPARRAIKVDPLVALRHE